MSELADDLISMITIRAPLMRPTHFRHISPLS